MKFNLTPAKSVFVFDLLCTVLYLPTRRGTTEPIYNIGQRFIVCFVLSGSDSARYENACKDETPLLQIQSNEVEEEPRPRPKEPQFHFMQQQHLNEVRHENGMAMVMAMAKKLMRRTEKLAKMFNPFTLFRRRG